MKTKSTDAMIYNGHFAIEFYFQIEWSDDEQIIIITTNGSLRSISMPIKMLR